MTFDWDAEKSDAKLRDREFNFEFATLVFEGPFLKEEDRRTAIRSAASSPPEGAIDVSGKRTRKRSLADNPSRGRADLGRLRTMGEGEINATSPPELADLPDDFWDEAIVVTPPPKEAISMRVDRDVLEWFRSRGPRYQTRINAVLRSYMNATRRPP